MGSFLKESEVNLDITKRLTKLFVASGFTVVNTRTEDICLCDNIKSPTFKLDDMAKRRKIIQNANPHILISVHCNKFYLSTSVGAQVFYQENAKDSEIFANTLTEYLVENITNAKHFALSGDYYILNSVTCPAVLVECGYLSNFEEEKLLATDTYRDAIAYAIYAGTLKFLLSDV